MTAAVLSSTTVDEDAISGEVVDEAPSQPAHESAGNVVAIRPGQALAAHSDGDGTLHIPTPMAGLVLDFTTDQTTLTDQQLIVLGPLGMDATWDPRQVAVFLMTYLGRGLDPWSKEVYLMRYRERDRDGQVGYRYVTHIGIDGLRAKAEDSGEYRGQAGPFWCGEDGEWREIWPHKNRPPYAAKVGIFRSALEGVVWGIAHFDEYAAYHEKWEGPDGARRKVRQLTPSWRPAGQAGKAALMTAKVAEALAFRKAFPGRFGGLYVPEEFHRAAETEQSERADREAEAARARRAEAMAVVEAAAQARQTIIIEPQPTPAASAVASTPDAAAKGTSDTATLLLAEQQVQAMILGTSTAALSNRYVAMHQTSREDMTPGQVQAMVHAVRPQIVATLRKLGLDPEAECYETAPDAATVALLFGRDADDIKGLLEKASTDGG